MRNIVVFVWVFLCGFRQCLAQQPIEALTYQLVNDVLMDLHPQTNAVLIKKIDGNYQAIRPRPVNNDNESFLLLDQLNYGWASEKFVESPRRTPEWNVLLKHFTEADIDYMRHQLPTCRHFTLRQAAITQPGVKILPLDTLLALQKRLDWRVPAVLEQRYGSRHIHGLGGGLFSLNHHKALIVVSTEYGYEVQVYENTGSAWYRKAVLQQGME